MFLANEERLGLGADDLYRLRISLNTPVVETDDVSEGRARAVLLVHFDEATGTTASVGIRSLETGRCVVYRYSPESQAKLAIEAAVEAGLDFAEQLGFHFGDEKIPEVDERAQAQALAVWTKFTSGKAKPRRTAGQNTDDPGKSQTSPGRLKKLVPADQEIELIDPVEFAPPSGSPTAPDVGLSKFRSEEASGDSSSEAPAPKRRAPVVVYPGKEEELAAAARHRGRREDDPQLASKALGRVQLVKRAISNPRAGEKRNPIQRLLGSF